MRLVGVCPGRGEVGGRQGQGGAWGEGAPGVGWGSPASGVAECQGSRLRWKLPCCSLWLGTAPRLPPACVPLCFLILPLLLPESVSCPSPALRKVA